MSGEWRISTSRGATAVIPAKGGIQRGGNTIKYRASGGMVDPHALGGCGCGRAGASLFSTTISITRNLYVGNLGEGIRVGDE